MRDNLLERRIHAFRRALLVAELKAADGNVREASENLGVSYNSFYRWMEIYDIPKSYTKVTDDNITKVILRPKSVRAIM